MLLNLWCISIIKKKNNNADTQFFYFNIKICWLLIALMLFWRNDWKPLSPIVHFLHTKTQRSLVLYIHNSKRFDVCSYEKWYFRQIFCIHKTWFSVQATKSSFVNTNDFVLVEDLAVGAQRDLKSCSFKRLNWQNGWLGLSSETRVLGYHGFPHAAEKDAAEVNS